MMPSISKRSTMAMVLASFDRGDDILEPDMSTPAGIIGRHMTGHNSSHMTDSGTGTLREELEIRRRVIRRRRWSDEEKLRILEEAFATGANRKAVADRHGIAPGQLYIWRKQLTALPAGEGFVPVHVDRQPTTARQTVMSSPLVPVEVVLPSGITIRAAAAFDPDLMCRLVHGLRRP